MHSALLQHLILSKLHSHHTPYGTPWQICKQNCLFLCNILADGHHMRCISCHIYHVLSINEEGAAALIYFNHMCFTYSAVSAATSSAATSSGSSPFFLRLTTLHFILLSVRDGILIYNVAPTETFSNLSADDLKQILQ